ncbi:MAG: nickel-dependent hydrogenase large subunit, partial [Desulfurococcales archaeon]|nr:nickel-dependent hydrogenase large subunit [Desulfurococcales archaeon]
IYHPWNKLTIPKRGARDWASKYSWSATVRLVWKDGRIIPFEVGPIIRLKITSLVGSEFGSAGKVRVSLPKSGGADNLPSAVAEPMDIEWDVPSYSSTIYRLWARAFNMLVDVAAAWRNVEFALGLVKSGNIETSRPWKAPDRITRGIGSLEAPRGTVRHWMVQKGGKLLNLQIQAPTTSNVSPSDEYGMSPFELAANNTVVTEETQPEEWVGLDFVRSIRSFDPCLACAVHATITSKGSRVKTIKRLLTPACTV